MLESLSGHPDNQDPVKQFAIRGAEVLLKEAKVSSTGPMVIRTRLDHERDWAKQAEDLAYYFAKPLGKSRWDYIDNCLPKYPPQSDSYRGRFDDLVLVQLPQPNLPLKRILEIVGIRDYNPDVLKAVDWSEHKGKFRTPNKTWSYATYLEDEDKRAERLRTAPAVVRKGLGQDARGGTTLDGVFLYAKDRGNLTRHYLDLPGSESGSVVAPALGLWYDEPRLGLFHVDFASPYCASVVAGDEVFPRELVA